METSDKFTISRIKTSVDVVLFISSDGILQMDAIQMASPSLKRKTI